MLRRSLFVVGMLITASASADTTYLSTGFEPPNFANGWFLNGNAVTTAAAHSGSYSLDVNTSTQFGASSPELGQSTYYVVSAWVESNGYGVFGTGAGDVNVVYPQGHNFQYITYGFRNSGNGFPEITFLPASSTPSGGIPATWNLATGPLTNTYIDDLTVTSATAAETAAAMNSYVSSYMPIQYNYAANLKQTAATQIPTTVAELKAGQTVNCLMVGDSIENDQNDSFFETRLAGTYSGSLNVTASTRNQTGVDFYADPANFNTWVGKYLTQGTKQLVMIGGISWMSGENGGTITAAQLKSDIAEFISEVHAADSAAEVLICTPTSSNTYDPANNPSALQPVNPNGTDLRALLEQAATADGVGFFDMTQEWAQYAQLVENDGLTYQWLQRDAVHDNSRGMQVEGQELGAFFDTGVPEPGTVSVVVFGIALALQRRRGSN